MRIRLHIIWSGLALSIGASPQTIVTNPIGDQAISQPAGTNLYINQAEHVAFADQYSAGSSTGGIQEAINTLPSGGGTVYIGAGTYTLAVGIVLSASNVTLIGAGDGTLITTSTANLNAIVITGSNDKIYDVYLKQTGSTPGSGIILDGAQNASLGRIHVAGFYHNVQIAGTASSLTSNVRIYDFLLENPIFGSITISQRLQGSNVTSLFVDSGAITGTATSGAGIAWLDGSGVFVSNVRIHGGSNGVEIIPGLYGGTQSATSGTFHNVQVESAYYTPWVISPGLSGVAAGITADNCTAVGSTTGSGIWIGGSGSCPAGSTIDGFRWVGGTISRNLQSGVQLTNSGCVSRNVSIQNARVDWNGNSTQYDGIAVSAGASHFSIVGNRIGPASQRYGASIAQGGSDYFVITGNDLGGNWLGGLSNLATGAHTAVDGNLTDP